MPSLPKEEPAFVSNEQMLATIPTLLRRKRVELALERLQRAAEDFEREGFSVTLVIKKADEN